MENSQLIVFETIKSIQFDKFKRDFSFTVNEKIYKTN